MVGSSFAWPSWHQTGYVDISCYPALENPLGHLLEQEDDADMFRFWVSFPSPPPWTANQPPLAKKAAGTLRRSLLLSTTAFAAPPRLLIMLSTRYGAGWSVSWGSQRALLRKHSRFGTKRSRPSIVAMKAAESCAWLWHACWKETVSCFDCGISNAPYTGYKFVLCLCPVLSCFMDF